MSKPQTQNLKHTRIQSLGAIVTESETRYYISSRKLSPLELLVITRNEWAVESMHWQPDVIFHSPTANDRKDAITIAANERREIFQPVFTERNICGATDTDQYQAEY